MSASYCPIVIAASTPAALDEVRRRHGAGLGVALADAVSASWRGRQEQTWCDTSFDAGWTFLALWRAWRRAEVRPQRLHVVGVVHQPYTRAVVTDVLQSDAPTNDDGWRGCARALAAQWPDALPGQHRLTFEQGHVTLTLLFGDPAQTLSRAGFLADGFLGARVVIGEKERQDCAQADALLGIAASLARHAAPGALWWAVDDAALRAAWRQVGFTEAHPAPPALMHARRRPDMPLRGEAARRPLAWQGERQAVIVGAGVAGAHAAHALARRGWRVTVLARDRPDDRHVCAAVTPVVARDDDARARLTRAGAACAASVWRQLADALPADAERAVWTCGTVQVDKPGGRAGDLADTLAHLAFPPGWVRAVGREAASRLAQIPVARGGLYFSRGMRVRPDVLVGHLLSHPNIVRLTGTATAFKRADGLWQAHDAGGRVLAQGTHIVLAASGQTPTLLADSGLLAPLPVLACMHRLGGEVTLLPAPLLDGGPACVVAGDGYVLPAVAGHVVVGSTYVRGAVDSQVSAAGQRTTLAKLTRLIDGPDVAATIPPGTARMDVPRWPGWAGWRAVVAGRLPQVGELPHAPGVWLSTALGSRGLTWAALAAEIIAGRLGGEPDILDADLVRQIAPR